MNAALRATALLMDRLAHHLNRLGGRAYRLKARRLGSRLFDAAEALRPTRYHRLADALGEWCDGCCDRADDLHVGHLIGEEGTPTHQEFYAWQSTNPRSTH